MEQIVAAAEAAAAATNQVTDALMREQAAIDALHGRDITIGVDVAAATAAAAATREMAAAAEGAAAAVDGLDAAEAGAAGATAILRHELADMSADLMMQTASLRSMDEALNIVKRDMADSSADLMMQTALLRDLRDQGSLTAAALLATASAQRYNAGAAVAAADAAGRASRGFYGWWSALSLVRGANIGLFGGIMGTVGGLHLLADAAIEVTAVVVPAAIALGAFGVAAAPAVAGIVTQMKNLYTVTTATGQSLYPLSGAFQRVADAVQPQVYQLFGDALRIVNRNTGTFQTLATGAGSVLDQLGARFTVAVTNGHGFNLFLANAVNDLAKLGDIVGNLGGALGHVFAAVPGYAQTLLNLADAGSKVIEWAAGVTQPVLKAGLALHGAWLYAGLGVTALARVIPGALSGIAGMAQKAGLAAAGSRLLGGAAESASAGMLAFAGGARAAAGLPWGWIAAAAAGIGVLVYAIVSAKDATQQWAASLEKTVQAAPAVNGLTALMVAQAAVSARLALAQTTLAHTSQTLAMHQLHTGQAIRVTNPAYQQAQQNVMDLAGASKILSDQSNIYRYRVAVLGGALGSTSLAMGMLAASGMKMSDFLKYGKNQLAQVEAQILGTAAAYRAMGQTGGMLGADMNVMNVLASDQYSAVMKLNQAWQTWMGTVTGGMSSLAQFETALTGMKNDAAATSAGLSGSISSIKQGVGGMTYTLRGFGPAAQQSWQQFTSAVNQGSTVIAQMRTYLALGAVSNHQFGSTVQALVGQMLQFTQGNRAALSMVDNLAMQAGYKGPASMKAMAQWAAVAGNAAKNQLAKGLEAGTIAAARLGTVALHMAATLDSAVTSAVSAAALKASGLQSSLATLATQINHGATMSTGFHNALGPVIASMVRLHQSVPAITSSLQLMGVQITQNQVKAILAAAHISTLGNNASTSAGKVASMAREVQILNAAINALHDKTILIRTIFQSSGAPGGAGMVGSVGGHTMRAQHGGVLPGFQPGADIIPAMLSPGESILNPYATRALGAGWINTLNTSAERGTVNPAALRTGGEPMAAGASGPLVIHVHVDLDGQQIYEAVQRANWRSTTRDSGSRTGLLVPGYGPQV